MNTSLPIKFVTLFASSLLVLSGCTIIDQITGDFTKSANNVKKEAEKIQTNLIEAKDSVDRKIQKVENVVNAVGDLRNELKN